MNKTIEAVKNGQKITAKELFVLVNDFCITQISLTCLQMSGLDC